MITERTNLQAHCVGKPLSPASFVCLSIFGCFCYMSFNNNKKVYGKAPTMSFSTATTSCGVSLFSRKFLPPPPNRDSPGRSPFEGGKDGKVLLPRPRKRRFSRESSDGRQRTFRGKRARSIFFTVAEGEKVPRPEHYFSLQIKPGRILHTVICFQGIAGKEGRKL